MGMKQRSAGKGRLGNKARSSSIIAFTLLFVLLSTAIAMAATAETLTVTLTGSNGTAAPGSNVVANTIELSAPVGDGITVSKVAISTTFSKTTGVPTYKLYIDNGDGVFNASTDTLRNHSSLSKGKYTYSSFNVKVNGGTVKKLFFVAAIPANAPIGAYLRTSMVNGDVTVTKPDSVKRFPSSPYYGPTITIAAPANIVTVSQTPVAVSSIIRGSDNNLIQTLDFSINTNSATITSVKVTRASNSTPPAADSDTKTNGVKLWMDNGDANFSTVTDTLLSSGSFSGGVLTFGALNVGVTTASAKKLYVTYDIAATAQVGASIGSQLAAAADVVVSSGNTVQLAATPLVSNLKTIASASDVLTVTHSAPANYSVQQLSMYQILDRLTFTAPVSSDGITVTSIRVDLTGTALPSDISLVRLVEDLNANGTFEAGTDVQLSSGTVSAGTVNLTLAPNFIVGPGQSRRLLVTVDLSGTAGIGRTVGTTIASPTYITVVAPDSVNAANFPMAGATLTITDNPDTAFMTQTMVAVGSLARSTTNNLIQVLNFANNEDVVTLTSLKVLRASSSTPVAMDSDTMANGIKLWLDSNGNGILDTGADVQLGAGTFVSGIVTFSNINMTITPATPRKVFITYDISATAQIGVNMGASIQALGDVQVVSPDFVSFTAPMVSAYQMIQSSNDMLTVYHAAPASFSAVQGSTNRILDNLSFAAPATGDGVTINTIRVDRTGTALSSDISAMKLIEDVNANGIYEPGLDPVLASVTLSGSSIIFALPANWTVSPSSVRRVLIAVDVSPNATVNATIASNIMNNAYVSVAGGDTVSSAGFPLIGATMTISDAPDVVTITQTAVAAGSLARSSDNNVVQVLNLTVNQDVARISSIRLTRASNSIPAAMDSDTKTSGVKLWLDNGDATFNAANDTIIGTAAFVGGMTTFGSLNLSVTPAAPNRLFVTLDISANAQIGATIGTQIATLSDVVVTAPDTVSFTAPLTSSLQTIVSSLDSLTASHNPPASFDAYPGAENVILDRLNLTAAAGGDGITINGVRIDVGGSLSGGDTESFKLIDDLNANGAYDVGTDVLLSSAVPMSSVTFALPANYFIAPGTIKRLLLVASLKASAPNGATLWVNLANNSYIVVSAPDVVNNVGFPMTSATCTVVPPTSANTLTVTQTAVATGSMVRASTNNLMQILNLSVNSGSTQVSAIRVTRRSTSSPVAIDADTAANGIKLWLDVNANGALEPATDTLLGSGSFSAGAVTFSSLNIDVAAATTRRVFITADISVTAQIGVNIGTQINTVSDVVVTAPDTVTMAAPLSGSMKTIVTSADTLNVSHAPRASFMAMQGATNQVLDKLTLAASPGDGVTVTSIRVDKGGTATSSDITSMALYEDVNNNGVIDVGIDPILASGVPASSITFSLPASWTIAAGASRNILITASLSNTATVGTTMMTNIANNTYITLAGLDNVATSGFPMAGATMTIGDKPDMVTITQSVVAVGPIARSSINNLVQVLNLTVNEDVATISSLRLTRNSTSTPPSADADTQANGVKVWMDNGDASFNAATDTLIGSGSFISGVVTLSGMNIAITPAAPRKLFVTLDVSATAQVGANIGTKISTYGDVAVGSPDTVSFSAPLTGSLQNIIEAQ